MSNNVKFAWITPYNTDAGINITNPDTRIITVEKNVYIKSVIDTDTYIVKVTNFKTGKNNEIIIIGDMWMNNTKSWFKGVEINNTDERLPNLFELTTDPSLPNGGRRMRLKSRKCSSKKVVV
jgi:hypothetical protein